MPFNHISYAVLHKGVLSLPEIVKIQDLGIESQQRTTADYVEGKDVSK